MADQTKSPDLRKVVRSQRIASNPNLNGDGRMPRDGSSEESPRIRESHDRDRTGASRSQTPNSIALKRPKPADLVIRQRSSSVLQPSSSKTPVSSIVPTPQIPHGLGIEEQQRPKTTAPSIAAIKSASIAGASSNTAYDANTKEPRDARRPAALRSTSAIVGKQSTTSIIPARQSTVTTQPKAIKGEYVDFPSLDSSKTAPDVPLAPASGMYWSQAPVSGAPHTALRAHTTTVVGSNVFIFGGCDSKACFNELYVLDGDSFHWSIPQVIGDVPVPLRAMTCTAVGKKIVVFGGGDGPAYYNHVYVLDTLSFRWTKPRIIGDKTPSKRRAHTACFYKNGIYVFGGGDGVRALNDIWRLDVSDTNRMSWRLVSSPDKPGGNSEGGHEVRPKARGYHTANVVGGKLIIFGGSDGGECFNDIWVYDIDRQIWKSVHIDETYRRLSHTATIVGSYLFVIGGHDGEEYSNDVLLLNLTTMTWEKRKTYGLPPSGRGYHGTVLYDSRLFIIGGFDGSEVFGDVWLLELAVHAYYSQISHFTIDV